MKEFRKSCTANINLLLMKGMKEMEPLVSVVMTNHNYGAFVAGAIQSVIDQTYTNWELILVDDASTDQSLEKIRSFSDPRIKLIINKKNGHFAFATNQGRAIVHGKYIATLDSDDRWEKEKLARQVSYLEEHPETVACFTWVKCIDENGLFAEDSEMEQKFAARNRSRSEWIHDLILYGNCLNNPSSMFRRDVDDQLIRYNLAVIQLPDYDQWVRMIQSGEFYVLEEPLVRYRRIANGASISTPSMEKFHRHYLEEAWIIGNTIRNMDDQLFLEAFQKEMLHHEAHTPEEIEIEKAMLLCSEHFDNAGVKLYGFEMMERLFQLESTAEQLREKYGFSQHRLYQMTGNPIFFDPLCRLEEEKLRSRVTELEDKVRLMEGSRWWKLGKQIRRLKNRDK